MKLLNIEFTWYDNLCKDNGDFADKVIEPKYTGLNWTAKETRMSLEMTIGVNPMALRARIYTFIGE